MFMRTTLEKIAFAVLAVFLCVTMGKDWYDLYTCGAVGQCLSSAGQLQLYTKFIMSCCLTVLAFLVAKRSFCARDGQLLRFAFMVFQAILIYRHSRENENDNSCPKVFWVIFAVAAVFAGLAIAGVMDAVVAEVLIYGGFVITSMVVGILAPRKAYFPKKNAMLVRWGMVAFLIGDVMVGLSMLSGDDHSALQVLACLANNLIWVFYVPAQLMIIRSATKE